MVIAGAEEGLFPHGSALEDPAELEEERRLFYVALTRARDEVLVTAAAYRRRFDGARGGVPSRFVDEIPVRRARARRRRGGVARLVRARRRGCGATRAAGAAGRATTGR